MTVQAGSYAGSSIATGNVNWARRVSAEELGKEFTTAWGFFNKF